MANEFIARNGLIVQNNLTITGSLTTTQGITGSLLGTASYATTASYVLGGGGGAAFPYVGTAEITGSLSVNDGTDLALDTTTRALYNSSGVSVDWGAGTLSKGASISIDWNGYFLLDPSNIHSADYASRYLIDPSNINSVDWGDQRTMFDTNASSSLLWGGRQLIKSDGTTVAIDWETGAFTGSLEGTASYASTASYLAGNNIGEANLNFGSTPGTNTVTTTILNANVTSNSYINIYIMNTSSIDHNTEDHKLFALYSKVIPGNIINNTSFDITGITDLRVNGIFKVKYIVNNF
jgi:hypothetical protein